MIVKPPPKMTNRNSLVSYIETSLWGWLKQLANELLSISFKENFQSFTVEDVIIPAGQQVSLSNEFKLFYPGIIPSGRIIIRQKGDAVIEDGDKWTASHVYLKNPSMNEATITVIFFR